MVSGSKDGEEREEHQEETCINCLVNPFFPLSFFLSSSSLSFDNGL